MADPTPAKAEAFSTDTELDFDGEHYVVAPATDWSLDALEAFEDGKMITFLRELLGPEQWATFKAKPRKSADVEGLANALMGASGTPNG